MYYGYIRKLELNRYIGFCVVINGLILTNLEGLFSLYENTIFTLVSNGQLMHFNERGNIVTNVDKLYMNREEIDLLTQTFRSGFYQLKNAVKPLPAINYGISKDTIKSFSIDSNIDDIIKSSHTFGYTFIFKSKDFNTSQLNSFKELIERLNKEKLELVSQCAKLEENIKKTIKQKKQFRFVAILFFLVLSCLIALVSLNNNLNITKSALYSAEGTVSELNTSLSDKNSQISILKNENIALSENYQNIKTNFDSLQTIVNERQPFIIKSTSFDFSTGYLLLDYFGFKNEKIKINVRAYNNNGTYISVTTDLDFFTGKNTNEIFINKNLNRNEWFTFVILREKDILGGGIH